MEVLQLTPTERGELQSYLRKRNLPASVAQRMRIVLLLDDGASYRDIEEKLGDASLDHLPLETTISAGWPAGSCHHPSRPAAAETHAGVAGTSVGKNPAASASRRLHALVASKDGGGDEGKQEPDRSYLERSRSEAAPAGTLHGFQRSAVRTESGGDYRFVPESAPKRGGVLCGREERDSSAGPPRPPLAVVTGTRREAWV